MSLAMTNLDKAELLPFNCQRPSTFLAINLHNILSRTQYINEKEHVYFRN